jgi:hypothetical protein
VADEDHNTVPLDASGYRPIVHGYADARVDTADPRYAAATKAAHAAKLTQHQFSQMLGVEAQRVSGAHAKPAAAAAPARAAPEVPYDQLSMSAKLAKFGHL